MTVLGRDHEKMEVSRVEFLIQGEKLFFVIADGNEHLHIFQYDPESASFYGKSNSRPTIIILKSIDTSCGYLCRTFLLPILKPRNMAQRKISRGI